MRIPLLVLAATLVATPALADKIYTADGKTITDVKIVEEGLQQVTYKDGRTERTVASQDVLQVEFEERPRQLDDAITSIEDGDLESAMILLEDYVGGVLGGKEERRFRWAPAHAAWRVVELKTSLGDTAGAIESAGLLIDSFPDSRYLPEAYMAKAEAAHMAQDAATAQETLKAFQNTIATRGLSERWGIECELALVTTDDTTTGPKRRSALQKVADKAGKKFTAVRNSALVAIGESYLADLVAAPDKADEYLRHYIKYGDAAKHPDWMDEARLAYTDRLAVLLADLLQASPELEGPADHGRGRRELRLSGRPGLRANAR